MPSETDAPRSVHTFDLSLVGAEHLRAGTRRRKAQAVLGYFVLGLYAVAIGYLLLFALFGQPLFSSGQFLAIGLATALLYVATRLLAATRKELKGQIPTSAEVAAAGAVTILFANEPPVSFDLEKRDVPLRIIDYRSTDAGVFEGAPCILGPLRQKIAITGPACDAILEVARSRGIAVNASPLPTASMTGRSLGKAVQWDINPGSGLRGWFRRNN